MQNLWLQTRRHFYEILKKQAELILGPPSSKLTKYEQHYRNLFHQVWEVSHLQDVYERLQNAGIVLGGDFHSFSQSQRMHLRLLKGAQKKQNRKIVLALEVFDAHDQNLLDQYLEGQLSFSQLLDDVSWNERWPGIPSHGYERLLDWALKEKIKVSGVNASKLASLKDRDQFSAQKIDELAKKHEDHLIYVIYGDFHLADSHLVSYIKHYQPERDLRVLLNSEELYFALAEHAVEDRFDVLKFKDCFCILSSPPWVKWQSYLLSLQELDDEFIDDSEEWGVDLTEYVAQLLSLLAKDFDLPDLSSQLSVYTSSEMDLEHVYSQVTEPLEIKKLEYMVATEKNLIFPQKGLQYLGRTTVNQAASLAGEILHAHLSRRQNIIWDESICFEAKVWIEAVSFFLSLTINPKRKALSEKDLRAQLEAQGEKEYAIDVLKLALDFRLSVVKKTQTGEERKSSVQIKDWQVEMEASVILGEMMGQRLYEAFRSGRIRKELLIHYFSLPMDSLKFMAMFDFLNAKLENKEALE